MNDEYRFLQGQQLMKNSFYRFFTRPYESEVKTACNYMLTRHFCLVFTVQLMVGCTLLPIIKPIPELASIQNQRAASAEIALAEIEEIDTLIKLDNRLLSEEIEKKLQSHAMSSGRFSFRNLNLNFARQHVSIKTILDIIDAQGNEISALTSGEILLDFNASGLEWLPRFSQLDISSKNFIFDDNSYAEPVEELRLAILQELNSYFTETIIEQKINIIPLNAAPLGEIQVGALLPGFSNSPALQTEALRGVFMIAGSAMLIDSSITAIALDMTFIPDLSTCPADVTVSRAEFAGAVESREPVGILRNIKDAESIGYFYSEISGAQRPLTIIHYWFADGLPVAVEELAVGPSERWRTWSTSGSDNSKTDHLEVLVVEKQSGCILHSQSIRRLESEPIFTLIGETEAKRNFMSFSDEFKARTADFSISGDVPGIALIEVRRQFLRDVLQASLADLDIDAKFDSDALAALNYSARLKMFKTEDTICELSSCPAATVCKTNITQCTRLRDTRDCSSCLFRNPLNNRCVREATDPLCEASRNRQNAKYETERTACIANAEALRLECEELNAQALRSCQMESMFEDSSCELTKANLDALKKMGTIASINALSSASGGLSANFSNFRIKRELTALKLDMTLKSDLRLDGKLNVNPGDIAHPITKCIAAWSAPFKSRFATTPTVNNMLSSFEPLGNTLVANWSGFGLTISTKPTPFESVFVSNPQLLANCKIGLTVRKVEQAVVGQESGFFQGQLDLEIQPLPTKIYLAPATIKFDNNVYSADARISTENLRYDIDG
jgi:hypothetical protein